MPSGSYVVLQATEKMISHCAEERERDRFNPTAQRRLSSHTSEVILTTEDKEDLVLMQRPATSEEETSSGAGYPSSSDPSSFVSTDRTAALTSEGREFTHPTLLRNRDFDWLSTVQNVRSFLTDYARTSRLHSCTDLLVHLITDRNACSRAVTALCHVWFLDQTTDLSRFLDWCQEHMFQLDVRRTRMFPVAGEIYQDTPSVVVVQPLYEGTVPIVVQIADADPESPPSFLVFRATAILRVASVVQWIQDQMELAPSLYRYNGRRVNWHEELEALAGSVFLIQAFYERELNNPMTSTEYTGTGNTLLTHDTWISMQSNSFCAGATNSRA